MNAGHYVFTVDSRKRDFGKAMNRSYATNEQKSNQTDQRFYIIDGCLVTIISPNSKYSLQDNQGKHTVEIDAAKNVKFAQVKKAVSNIEKRTISRLERQVGVKQW